MKNTPDLRAADFGRMSESELLSPLPDIIGRMIACEPLATECRAARFFSDAPSRVLFVYGTEKDDLRDWKCNLSMAGERFDCGPGELELTEGSKDYAEAVLDGLRIWCPTKPFDLVVGHSLGATAVPWLCNEFGCSGVQIGAPRGVGKEGTTDGDEEVPILDITHPHDPITQFPPWNHRLPPWYAKRLRLPGHWTGALKRPLSLLGAGLLSLLLPIAGVAGLTWLGNLALRSIMAPHRLSSYKAAIEDAIRKEDGA